MHVRLVIFDFDGTLTDSFPWFVGVLGQVADEFGFRRVRAEEEAVLRASGPREIMRRLGIPLYQVPRIAARMRALKAQSIDRIPLFTGVPALLEGLHRQGLRLAIVSSDAEANVRRGLGPDHAALIDFYECGVSLFGKRARLRRVLRRAGVSAVHALFVGDEIRDAEAARGAGIAFAGVAWGFASPQVLAAQEPWALFEAVPDIGRRLEEAAMSPHPGPNG